MGPVLSPSCFKENHLPLPAVIQKFCGQSLKGWSDYCALNWLCCFLWSWACQFEDCLSYLSFIRHFGKWVCLYKHSVSLFPWPVILRHATTSKQDKEMVRGGCISGLLSPEMLRPTCSLLYSHKCVHGVLHTFSHKFVYLWHVEMSFVFHFVTGRFNCNSVNHGLLNYHITKGLRHKSTQMSYKNDCQGAGEVAG